MAVGIRRLFDDAKAGLDRLSARERLMVGGLAATFVVLVTFGFGYWLVMELDELKEDNAAKQTALKEIQRLKHQYLERRRRNASVRSQLSPTPLELNTYVEQAASLAGVKIDESSEATAASVEGYSQRGIQIKMHKVSISQLATLLKKLEGTTTHIVQITKLEVTTRWKKHEELDVTMVVTTYQRETSADAKKEAARS